MEWQLVNSDAELARLLAEHAGATAVAVDTEFMRRSTFYPQVALVQLCFGDRAWLIDPLALADPSPLAELLRAPQVVKVLHSASEDLEVFQHWLGVLPQPLFDTQRATALVDRGFGLGYRALVQQICAVDVPKSETCSDWLQRPLSNEQCDYAALDVAYLLPVWEVLQGACDAQDKSDWVLADGTTAALALSSSGQGYHTRIKSAWKLNREQLGVLAAVAAWREQTARQRDKPRGWIIDDQTCLQLAQANPENQRELQAGVELAPGAARRYGNELLEVLSRQREQAESSWPPRLPAPLNSQERKQAKLLKREAKSIANLRSIAPEVLLQARDYEALLREAAGDAVIIPDSWHGWRGEVVIEPLRKILAQAGR